jgi:hypothetical protein
MKHLYSDKRQAAEKEGREFKVSFDEFELISHSSCFYCGRVPSARAHFHVQHGPKKHCGHCPPLFLYHGIDRFDNRFGYIVGNMVPCCPVCNRAKKNLTVESFFEHSKLLLQQQGFWPSRIQEWTQQ